MKRVTANEEWWQVYGVGGKLVAEYRAASAPMTATKEYGYRGGELLVTMASGDGGKVKMSELVATYILTLLTNN